MRYSIVPKDRSYVRGYGFSSFAKNIGKNIAKNLTNKFGQKPVDTAKKSATIAIKTASKRAIQKKAEATGDLISNKTADKITSASKKPTKNLQMKLIIKYQKKDIYLQKKDNKLYDNIIQYNVNHIILYNNRISKNSKFVR